MGVIMTQEAWDWGGPRLREWVEGKGGLLVLALVVKVAKDEEEADENGDLDGYDEGEVFGETAVVLFDGEGQHCKEEEREGDGGYDVFGKFHREGDKGCQGRLRKEHGGASATKHGCDGER